MNIQQQCQKLNLSKKTVIKLKKKLIDRKYQDTNYKKVVPENMLLLYASKEDNDSTIALVDQSELFEKPFIIYKKKNRHYHYPLQGNQILLLSQLIKFPKNFLNNLEFEGNINMMNVPQSKKVLYENILQKGTVIKSKFVIGMVLTKQKDIKRLLKKQLDGFNKTINNDMQLFYYHALINITFYSYFFMSQLRDYDLNASMNAIFSSLFQLPILIDIGLFIANQIQAATYLEKQDSDILLKYQKGSYIQFKDKFTEKEINEIKKQKQNEKQIVNHYKYNNFKYLVDDPKKQKIQIIRKLKGFEKKYFKLNNQTDNDDKSDKVQIQKNIDKQNLLIGLTQQSKQQEQEQNQEQQFKQERNLFVSPNQLTNFGQIKTIILSRLSILSQGIYKINSISTLNNYYKIKKNKNEEQQSQQYSIYNNFNINRNQQRKSIKRSQIYPSRSLSKKVSKCRSEQLKPQLTLRKRTQKLFTREEQQDSLFAQDFNSQVIDENKQKQFNIDQTIQQLKQQNIEEKQKDNQQNDEEITKQIQRQLIRKQSSILADADKQQNKEQQNDGLTNNIPIVKHKFYKSQNKLLNQMYFYNNKLLEQLIVAIVVTDKKKYQQPIQDYIKSQDYFDQQILQLGIENNIKYISIQSKQENKIGYTSKLQFNKKIIEIDVICYQAYNDILYYITKNKFYINYDDDLFFDEEFNQYQKQRKQSDISNSDDSKSNDFEIYEDEVQSKKYEEYSDYFVDTSQQEINQSYILNIRCPIEQLKEILKNKNEINLFENINQQNIYKNSNQQVYLQAEITEDNFPNFEEQLQQIETGKISYQELIRIVLSTSQELNLIRISFIIGYKEKYNKVKGFLEEIKNIGIRTVYMTQRPRIEAMNISEKLEIYEKFQNQFIDFNFNSIEEGKQQVQKILFLFKNQLQQINDCKNKNTSYYGLNIFSNIKKSFNIPDAININLNDLNKNQIQKQYKKIQKEVQINKNDSELVIQQKLSKSFTPNVRGEFLQISISGNIFQYLMQDSYLYYHFKFLLAYCKTLICYNVCIDKQKLIVELFQQLDKKESVLCIGNKPQDEQICDSAYFSIQIKNKNTTTIYGSFVSINKYELLNWYLILGSNSLINTKKFIYLIIFIQCFQACFYLLFQLFYNKNTENFPDPSSIVILFIINFILIVFFIQSNSNLKNILRSTPTIQYLNYLFCKQSQYSIYLLNCISIFIQCVLYYVVTYLFKEYYMQSFQNIFTELQLTILLFSFTIIIEYSSNKNYLLLFLLLGGMLVCFFLFNLITYLDFSIITMNDIINTITNGKIILLVVIQVIGLFISNLFLFRSTLQQVQTPIKIQDQQYMKESVIAKLYNKIYKQCTELQFQKRFHQIFPYIFMADEQLQLLLNPINYSQESLDNIKINKLTLRIYNQEIDYNFYIKNKLKTEQIKKLIFSIISYLFCFILILLFVEFDTFIRRMIYVFIYLIEYTIWQLIMIRQNKMYIQFFDIFNLVMLVFVLFFQQTKSVHLFIYVFIPFFYSFKTKRMHFKIIGAILICVVLAGSSTVSYLKLKDEYKKEDQYFLFYEIILIIINNIIIMFEQFYQNYCFQYLKRQIYILQCQLIQRNNLNNDLINYLLPSYVLNRITFDQTEIDIKEVINDLTIVYIEIINDDEQFTRPLGKNSLQQLNIIYKQLDKLGKQYQATKLENYGIYYVTGFGIEFLEKQISSMNKQKGQDNRAMEFAFDVQKYFSRYTLSNNQKVKVRISITKGKTIMSILGYFKPQVSFLGEPMKLARKLLKYIQNDEILTTVEFFNSIRGFEKYKNLDYRQMDELEEVLQNQIIISIWQKKSLLKDKIMDLAQKKIYDYNFIKENKQIEQSIQNKQNNVDYYIKNKFQKFIYGRKESLDSNNQNQSQQNSQQQSQQQQENVEIEDLIYILQKLKQFQFEKSLLSQTRTYFQFTSNKRQLNILKKVQFQIDRRNSIYRNINEVHYEHNEFSSANLLSLNIYSYYSDHQNNHQEETQYEIIVYQQELVNKSKASLAK